MDAHDLGVLIPILVPIAMFAMIFGIVYLRSREKMAMIERGMDPHSGSKPINRNYVLTWGLLLIGAGVGLFLAYLLDNFAFQSRGDDNNVPIYFALIGVFGGAGLFISYLIEKKEQKEG